MSDRLVQGLARTVIAVLVLALLCGMLLPVYTDEVGWRFQERAGLDGVDKLFNDLCGPASLAVPRWFMWPARWYSALFNSLFAAPVWVRVSGVLYALTFVAMVIRLVRQITPAPRMRAALVTIGLGLLTLGVMPLLLVWSRPEQPIVLATCAALLLAMADGPGKGLPRSARSAAWIRSLAIAACAAVALSYHVKGVFVIPAMLGCLWYASRGRDALLPRAAGAAVIIAMTGQAYGYWSARLACPGNAQIAAHYARNNVSGALVDLAGPGQALDLLAVLFANLGIYRYVALAKLPPLPLSSWLEPHQIGAVASERALLALEAIWTAGLLLALVAALVAVWKGLRSGRVDRRVLLGALLFAAVLGWSATQLVSNVYEAILALPLLALTIILTVAAAADHRWFGMARDGTAALVGVCAVLSAVLTATVFGPSLLRANRQAGYIAAQPYSTPVFGFRALAPEIRAVAKLCRLPEPRAAQGLMLDDLTYFAYLRSWRPQHQLGVIGLWSGGVDPVEYLKSRNSSGAIVGCHLLPPDLRARAKAHGRFCCLGPDEW